MFHTHYRYFVYINSWFQVGFTNTYHIQRLINIKSKVCQQLVNSRYLNVSYNYFRNLMSCYVYVSRGSESHGLVEAKPGRRMESWSHTMRYVHNTVQWNELIKFVLYAISKSINLWRSDGMKCSPLLCVHELTIYWNALRVAHNAVHWMNWLYLLLYVIPKEQRLAWIWADITSQLSGIGKRN